VDTNTFSGIVICKLKSHIDLALSALIQQPMKIVWRFTHAPISEIGITDPEIGITSSTNGITEIDTRNTRLISCIKLGLWSWVNIFFLGMISCFI
jgi:hypothetical protein